MVRKNPRFRHRFSFSGSPERKSETSATSDDIVNSLNRQSQTGGPFLEVREEVNQQTAQPVESYESDSVSKHRSAKRWIATLTLLGAPVALWLSGVLPAQVVSTADSGIDYVVSKATSLGLVLSGEIATMGLVIVILGMRMRHGSSHTADTKGE